MSCKWLLLGLYYFAGVFTAGFILGILRVELLVPLLSERYAELLELPFMIGVSFFWAKYLITLRVHQLSFYSTAVIGLVALALMLLLEFTLVLHLRGITVAQYLQARDPVSAIAYLCSLVVYACFPMLIYYQSRAYKR